MSGNDDNNEDDEGAEGKERRFCWRWREMFVCDKDKDIGDGGDDEKVNEDRCEDAMDVYI